MVLSLRPSYRVRGEESFSMFTIHLVVSEGICVRQGVANTMKEELLEGVKEVKKVNSRLMWMREKKKHG